jgi:hypothetical protein
MELTVALEKVWQEKGSRPIVWRGPRRALLPEGEVDLMPISYVYFRFY